MLQEHCRRRTNPLRGTEMNHSDFGALKEYRSNL